jgi:hypothetical protein
MFRMCSHQDVLHQFEVSGVFGEAERGVFACHNVVSFIPVNKNRFFFLP